MGLLGVALGTLLASLCTSAWLIPMLACKYIELPIMLYIRQSLLPPLGVGVAAVGVILLFRENLASANDFFMLTFNGVLVVLIYAGLYFTFASTRYEKQMCLRLFQRKVNR